MRLMIIKGLHALDFDLVKGEGEVEFIPTRSVISKVRDDRGLIVFDRADLIPLSVIKSFLKSILDSKTTK